MYRFALLICILISITGCRKVKEILFGTPNRDDLSGSETISGIAIIRNEWDKERDIPFANDSVFISQYADSSKPYLYSVMTNSSGAFTFTNLKEDITYYIIAHIHRNTRLDTDVLFTGDTSSKSTSTAIQLTIKPDPAQYGLYITCTDMSGFPLPEDSVYIYTSPLLAANDSAQVTGAGSSYRFTTKTDGTALKMNLPYSKDIYINVAKTFGSLRLKSVFSPVRLNATEIKRDTLKLK